MNVDASFVADESARVKARAAFVAAHGYADAVLQALPADASSRRYFRLTDRSVLLMDSPPLSEPLEPFLQVAALLRGQGLSAPKVLAADSAQGLALVEDFGHNTYTRLLKAGADEQALYELAVDCLASLHQAPATFCASLAPYDQVRLVEEAALFIDWYAPLLLEIPTPALLRSGYLDLVGQLCAPVAARRQTLVLRDFHVDNLMLLEGRSGVAACGLLDFQDALQGAYAYDLMSLLEDARRDIAAPLAEQLLARYLKQMPELDHGQFSEDYAILAAQRHAKVLGIFVRLAQRDGKLGYLAHLPRVLRLFKQALAHPALQPLREFLDEHLPSWADDLPIATLEALRSRSL